MCFPSWGWRRTLTYETQWARQGSSLGESDKTFSHHCIWMYLYLYLYLYLTGKGTLYYLKWRDVIVGIRWQGCSLVSFCKPVVEMFFFRILLDFFLMSFAFLLTEFALWGVLIGPFFYFKGLRHKPHFR